MYCNYHKHTHVSNISSLDCVVKPEEYMQRATELGHTEYFTTEHGYQGNIFDVYTLCQKHNLKCIYGVELYYVDDRHEKDKGNYHLIAVAMNENGRKQLNKIISTANEDGFYYKARVDKELVLSLNPNDVVITSACVASRLFKGDNWLEEFFLPMYKHFGDNFYLEVQNHNHESQIFHNKQILELARKYNVKIIHANDSHYIKPEDSKYRKLFLKAKGIEYGDEDTFILDYPDEETIIQRYKEQGVLTDAQIREALENTLIFKNATGINIDKEFKIPKVTAANEDSDKVLAKIINEAWKKERVDIPKEQWQKYISEIRYEYDMIKKCGMSDYFIIDYKIAKRAIEKYDGVLTHTGRGCFTKDAIIYAKDSLKPINEIKIGDMVLSDDCRWHKVINTMEYDIEEDMVEFEYTRQGSSYKKFKNICTLDHKILVKTDKGIIYKQAGDLKLSDKLCSPKIKHEYSDEIIIDLNDYNDKCFYYDDEYIYEKVNSNISYPYSPKDVENKIGISSGFCKKIGDGKLKLEKTKTQKTLKKLMDNIPFKTVDDYKKYINKHGHIFRKIPRYIKMDYLWNSFIGLMYADGFTNENSLGLAINNTTKDGFNKKVFYMIAERLNLDIVVNESKNRNLVQLYITSNIISKWFKSFVFQSKKGIPKKFNTIFLNQSKDNLKWIYKGMIKADGSVDMKSNKMSYDSTSLSLISAFKTLHNIIVRNNPLALDIRFGRIDNRGYNCAESYKIRGFADKVHRKEFFLNEDDNYWFLPITKINILSKIKTKVYDMTVEDSHSYTINNIIVHNSGVSFYINKLLGLTEVDRIWCPVKLYPTRFMSDTRILESRSLPDIDQNWADVTAPIKASQDFLGMDGIRQMVSFKPMQVSSAFRLWCKANDLNINEYDEVAKKIKDEKFNIDDLEDKWKDLLEGSKIFRGVIESIAPSPCSYLLYDKPISEEIGLIAIGSGDNKVMCCVLDGYNCDYYKYLKNDYLIVTVWDIISKVYKKIGQPIDDIKELIPKCDEKVWKLFEDCITATINQCDTDFGKQTLKIYKPKSIEELSAYVASIRPSFANNLDTFRNRLPYSTGVAELDELLKDSSSFLMYQESLMTYFSWLGIPEKSTYDIIKKISKKKFKEDELNKLKETLSKGWLEKIGNLDMFEKTWLDVQNAARYSFNA